MLPPYRASTAFGVPLPRARMPSSPDKRTATVPGHDDPAAGSNLRESGPTGRRRPPCIAGSGRFAPPSEHESVIRGRRKPGTFASFARWPLAAALLALGVGAAGDGRAGAPELTLTLDEAVRLALRNNRTLLSARHAREVQKLSLAVSGDRYRPRASIGASVRDAEDAPATGDLTVGPGIRTPIGSEIRLNWSSPLLNRADRARTWSIGVSQPLLRGFGAEVDSAPLRLAQIGERKNILSFRDAIAGVIGAVVKAYRSVIRAHRAIAISRESLARAERQLAINRSLIRAGRMAVRELVQTEAEIANRELALVRSENGLNLANAALISVLDIDRSTRILPVEGTPPIEPVRLDPETSIETALANRSDFLGALMEREAAEINLRLARDGRRWDLILDASVSGVAGGERDRAVGLGLSIPLGDRSPRLAEVRAENQVRDAAIALEELRQSIPIQVRQALHDVEVGFRLVGLARRARELAEEKVEVEQRKLAQGLTSTFQLTSVEDDLVGAQTSELDAGISYLNALTALDVTLGTTLRTWNVDAEAFESGPPAAERDPEDGAERTAAERTAAQTRTRRRPEAVASRRRVLWLTISGIESSEAEGIE